MNYWYNYFILWWMFFFLNLTWTRGRGARTHHQKASHPVTFQVLAEEWIVKAKITAGCQGIRKDSWLAKTRFVWRMYLSDLHMMSHFHEAVIFAERKNESSSVFLRRCVIARLPFVGELISAKDFIFCSPLAIAFGMPWGLGTSQE